MTSRKSQGKTFILATAGVAVLAWAGITFLPTDSVVAGNGPKPSSGTLACGGYYTSDQQHTLRWVFTNHNDTAINITGFRVYDWDGTKVWDSATDGGGFPPRDRNRLIGPPPVNNNLGSNTIEAYATAWYGSEDLAGLGVLPQHPADPTPPAHLRNHVKVHVDWSAATNVDALAGMTVRHVYTYPEKNGPWGRSTSACRDIDD